MSDENIPDQQKQLQQRTNAAISGGIPHYYCNGFTTTLTGSDVVVVLEQNGIPLATVNLSFTTAKTIAVKTGALIASLESASERQILTSDEITQIIPKLIESSKDN